MLTTLRIWRCKWQLRQLRHKMAEIDDEAVRKHDPTLSDEWYSANRWDFEALNREITNNLIAQAEGYDLALPPKSDTSMWDEGFDNIFSLTPNGQRTVRTAIR